MFLLLQLISILVTITKIFLSVINYKKRHFLTALEIINILFVACETKVRRKEQEEEKTNNYCIWNTLESGNGVQVLTFIGFF